MQHGCPTYQISQKSIEVLNGLVFLVLLTLLVTLPERCGQGSLHFLLTLLDAGFNTLLLLTVLALLIF